MAFIAVPNTAKVVAHFSLNTRPWSNTFWFYQIGFDDSALQDLADAVDENWGGGIKAIISDQGGYGYSRAYDMRSIIGTVLQSSTSAGNGGHSTTDAIAISTAMCLTQRTAHRGRSGRGRVYVSGFAEDQWTGGQFITATVNAVVAAYASMRGAVLSLGWAPVIVSHQLDGVPQSPPATYPITDYSVRSPLEAHQRRRTGRP